MFNLSGKVALIAGASGGIGREVARTFLEADCHVALTYHSNPSPTAEIIEVAKRGGRRATAEKIDASDPVQARRMIDTTIQTFGHIDIFISCLGAHLPQGFSPFVKQDVATWRGILDSQLLAFIFLARPILEHMLQRRSGRIISLSSDGGKVGESGAAVANAGTAGLIGFVKSVAREVGRSGITANLVCPGPIEGPTLDMLRNQGDAGARMVEEMIRRVPMKRVGTGQDIANAMMFLASDEAAYITGQAISVSGGLVMN